MDQGSSSTQSPVPEVGAVTTGGRTTAVAVGPTAAVRRAPLSIRLRDYGGSFLFVLPYLLFFLAFLLGPLLYALWVSLHKWSTIGGDQGWVGFQHYQRILFDTASISFDDFWRIGMFHTLVFVVISVPVLVFLALSLALLLANAPWRNFFRALFYIPSVLSVTVACTVWLWIFQPTGMLNSYLHTHVSWTVSQPFAWIAIIAATMWWTIGFNMVVLLAGIIEIPNDYYEAAKIDGANTWERILHITLPILRPILAFVLITQMLASFGLFGQPYVMTGGGPNRSTEPVVMTILNKAFGPDQDLATASAMSFIMGIIMIILALAFIRFFRATEA